MSWDQKTQSAVVTQIPLHTEGKKRTVKNGTLYPHHITITHIGRSKSFVTRGRYVFVLSRYCCLKFVSFCTNVRRNIVTSCSRKIVDLVPKSSLTSATAYFFFTVEASYLFSDPESGSEA